MAFPGAKEPAPARPSTALIWSALGSVYVIWSTTYLAIAEVNDTLPPLSAAGLRFLIAGSAMYLWGVRRGDVQGDRPGPRQWHAAAVVGALLVLGGNGQVVLAERTIPSGLVALLFATFPLWIALLDRVVGKRRIGARTVTGLVAGFVGAALLVEGSTGGDLNTTGLLFAVLAPVSWALGSRYSRDATLPRRPLVAGGMQMLAGGALMLVVGALSGELGRIDPGRFSTSSLVALGYLIVFGSWIGFNSYLWLLRVARTALVTTYAYVTPVFAVILGWLIRDEPVSTTTVVAGAVVLASVALIVSAGGVARDDVEAGVEGAAVSEPSERREQRRAAGEGELDLERAGDAEEKGLAEDGGGELEPDG